MFKIVFISSILIFSLKANTLLLNKIENLIGTQSFNTHKNLITLIFKNEEDFSIGKNLNYIEILNKLKENGLLKLRLPKPKEILVEFRTNHDPIKSLKILNDTLKSLGYYYFFTKKTKYNGKGDLYWSIKLKTRAVIDPLILAIELKNHNSQIINITKKENDNWEFIIDTLYSDIKDALFIDKNEKVSFKKPLKPYLIKINKATKLEVLSKKLNNWYPHIVFYDQHLNILRVIKEDFLTKQLSIKIPKNSTYIKVTDLYTLINIKRGLIISIKD